MVACPSAPPPPLPPRGFISRFQLHATALCLNLVTYSRSPQHVCREYWVLSTTVVYSLLPLLHQPQEYALKLLMAALHCLGTHALLDSPALPAAAAMAGESERKDGKAGGEGCSDSMMEHGRVSAVTGYVWGFMLLEVYCGVLHPVLVGSRMEFLPLMLVSLYCAIGVTAAWARMAAEFCRCCGSHAHAKAA